MSALPQDLAAQVAAELKLPARGVAATISLLTDGNTVPFVARYRKEATGGSTRSRSATSRATTPPWSSSRPGAPRSSSRSKSRVS